MLWIEYEKRKSPDDKTMSAHKISNTALGGAMVFSITKARGLFHEDYVLMLHNLRKANIARQRSWRRHSNKIYAVPKICLYPMSRQEYCRYGEDYFHGGGDPGILEAFLEVFLRRGCAKNENQSAK